MGDLVNRPFVAIQPPNLRSQLRSVCFIALHAYDWPAGDFPVQDIKGPKQTFDIEKI
jgi:hypothetical protein